MGVVDPVLLGKIQTAIRTNLMTIIGAVVAGTGLNPLSVINMVRVHLNEIETNVKEEIHEAISDVPVPGVGNQRSQAEDWVEATHPEACARLAADVRGERGVQSPEASTPVAEGGGEEDGTGTGLGLDPGHPF